MSTNFAPRVYSSESRLQLSSEYTFAYSTAKTTSTVFTTSATNTINTFKDDFFFASHSKDIKTVKWKLLQTFD